MIITTTRGRMLASSILVGAAALAFAAPAFAQTAPQPSGADRPPVGPTPASVGSDSPPSTGGQEVVVTGSRIRQPNLTSTSPLTVVNHQELVFQGTTNVESLLNNLPQVTANQTSQVSNGSNGTASLNLRNLGTLRTLVLVDGKRLEPGDSTSGGATDINNIPAALVDRVDVVTGGASAVYGSDAVAGVVNFILKKNFEGLRIDAQTSFYNHQNGNDQAKGFLGRAPYLTGPLAVPGDVDADGWVYNVSAILGANSPDDKGNITTYADYRHLTPVLQSTRDYSACTVVTDRGNNNANNLHQCGGSSNTAYGRFDNTGPKDPNTGRGKNGLTDNPDGSKTFVANSGAYTYNFGPVNYLQREDDTYRAGYFGHYKLNDALDVYSDFMFMRDQTDAQIAPSGLFLNTGPNLTTGFTFNCNNPLIGASQAAALCPGSTINPGAAGGDLTTTSIRYRFATAPRNTDFVHSDYKVDIGARGDLGQGWHYDAYLQYGRSDTSNYTTNYASLSRVQDALNVITVNGQNVCASGNTGCVPLDIFSSLGRNFTKEALAYVLVPAFQTGSSIEQVAHADISGDLGQYGVKSPFADEGLGVAFGTEYRREYITTHYDTEQQTADLSGGGGQALDVTGAFDVYELFGEARLPLVSNKPFIKDLSVDVGYRFSDYSTSGKTDTYKAEANYSPTPDVRVRFSYNRAERAPSAVELFTPQVAGLGTFTDPCASDTGTPSLTQAQCARTGLNPALYGSLPQCASGQCEILSGGNPALKPEVADTYAIGAVFTPRFFRGFSASVDYFNIDITGVITGGALPSTILSGCATGNDFYCTLIHRDQQGTINSAQGYVLQTNVNSGQLQTRGVDFTANYRLPFNRFGFTSAIPGALNFDLVGTWTEDLTFQPQPLSGHYNCAGLFGPICGSPQPHWRGSFRTTWLVNSALNVSANVRYTGRVKLDYNNANPLLSQAGIDFVDLDRADGKIAGYAYLDLAATYRFKDRYTFRVGVNNILDKDPPILDSNYFAISGPPYGNANTFPGVYDSLGRQIFMGVTADF